MESSKNPGNTFLRDLSLFSILNFGMTIGLGLFDANNRARFSPNTHSLQVKKPINFTFQNVLIESCCLRFMTCQFIRKRNCHFSFFSPLVFALSPPCWHCLPTNIRSPCKQSRRFSLTLEKIDYFQKSFLIKFERFN